MLQAADVEAAPPQRLSLDTRLLISELEVRLLLTPTPTPTPTPTLTPTLTPTRCEQQCKPPTGLPENCETIEMTGAAECVC